MKTRTKRLIIIIVAVAVVIIGGLVGFVVFSNLTTTTIKDLRIVDAASGIEINEKNVFLTAKGNNYFDIKLKTSSSSLTSYTVLSSDTSVAYVSATNEGYRIYYSKTGNVKITATTVEASDIEDSFILNVDEYVPTEFLITDKSATSEREIEIYSDNREYRFDFEAYQGNIKENINKSSILVLDTYDKTVFKSVYIDDIHSQLVISAYQSEQARKEIITIQSKQTDNDGNSKTVNTFVINVTIKGNYISDIQLMLSETPNFNNSKYIYGEGLLNKGEERVSAIFLTDAIHTVYAKVRVVYTNGEMFDVTQNVSSETVSGSPKTTRPQLSDYYSIDIQGSTAIIKFSYVGKEEGVSLVFNHLTEGETGYNQFTNNSLYKKITDYNGNIYYEYIYWDVRFAREDAITDENGNIVDFVEEPPTCAGLYE